MQSVLACTFGYGFLALFSLLSISIQQLPANKFTKIIKFCLLGDMFYGITSMLYYLAVYVKVRTAYPEFTLLIHHINFIGNIGQDSSLYAGFVLTWYCYYIVVQGGYMRTILDGTIIGILLFEILLYSFRYLYFTCVIHIGINDDNILDGIFQIFQLVLIFLRGYMNLETFKNLFRDKKRRYTAVSNVDSSFVEFDRQKYAANEVAARFILVFTVSDLIHLVPLNTYCVLSNIFGYSPFLLFDIASCLVPVKGFLHLVIIFYHRSVIGKRRLTQAPESSTVNLRSDHDTPLEEQRLCQNQDFMDLDSFNLTEELQGLQTIPFLGTSSPLNHLSYL